MTETRIKISSILENQLPQFVLEEFPLVSEFLSQYYTSLENQGGSSDILQNIDQYIKIDHLTNLIESTTLSTDVTFFDTAINVVSTAGFPDSYGLLLIDSEIITYTSKTSTTFEGCVRGFSGITSHKIKDELTFKETEAQEHSSSATVSNLSVLFLKEFLIKVKKQVTPGFEERELYSDLNERLFIKQSIDFYSSKGTDDSFKILFGALYGQNVEIIRPRDYLIQPSDAQYRITSDLVVEKIEGDPENLINTTLYQEETEYTEAAQGTVTKVEKIRRGNKDYYVISLDSDYDKDISAVGSIYGKFQIHPKTKIVSSIISGSTTLEVDSTVAFPNTNGTLVIDLDNQTSLTVTYTSKTLNQFFGCVGITQDIPASTEVKTNSFASSSDKKVKVRILGVLSDFKVPNNTRFYSSGDTIKIKTLGVDLKDSKANNWFFNIPTKYNVSSIQLLDSSDRSYKINTYINHSFKVGDIVSLLSFSGVSYTGNVISFDNERSFTIQLGSNINLLDESQTYIANKVLLKAVAENYSSVNQFTTNVQNVYSDGESLYVASPSLPSYLNRSLKINDRSVVFSGTFSGTTLNVGKHGFYTGDSIVYKPLGTNSLGIATGVYFIKKISDTEVKLSRSRTNIFTENFVSVGGSVTAAKFELADFTYRDLSTQSLESQKLIRKISEPEIDGNVYETKPGLTGIFINGVENLNYKSKDNVYYGPIESIAPAAPGNGYDIINPPVLNISDPNGSGASGYCSVVGGLERINIIDPGFDYLDEPKIEITGGNGTGASAKTSLISFDHSVSFNSISAAGLVKLNPTNTIGFYSYHKFRDAEEVVYITDSQTSVGGLSTNSTYFVSVQNATDVKLHKSFIDAVAGINTIQLTSYGVGNHSFKSKNKKKQIGSITIENSGINYQNKLVTTGISGINTASNSINISNHGYNTGEVIVYNATENVIGGLSSATSYYVTKIDDSQFKLSQIGIGTIGITTSFYFDTKQYINLTSVGSGIHKFNYPEIKVSVRGRIGVSTLTGQDFNAIVQPIFRGGVQSVFVNSGGSKYGSEDIINHNRQPLVELSSGSGIELRPIVSNGQIVDVLVNSSGSGYNSPPNLAVNGSGIGALLTPILSNGTLVEVKVIYGGIGYDQSNTSITVTPAGSGAKFEAQIKSWKINLVQRLLENSQIQEDDGILDAGLNVNYGLQYAHAYAPRSLRSSIQATKFKDGQKIYVPDLQTSNNKEVSNSDDIGHSPVIGWAYDGNPIYGPNGYSSKTGGAVRSLRSGYELDLKDNRPSVSIYPQGFFIEDYTYTGNGDLDAHNGRFGITPEYPNGVYAYFTTINSGDVELTGLFTNYKKPVFPYVIGNSYKSKVIDFNFKNDSSQDHIDINQTNWKRNITPYNISSYEYLFNPNSIKSQESTVKNVSTGSIDSIGIETGGQNYKIGDKLIFNNRSGFGAKAKVFAITGKAVNQISVASSSFDDVRFCTYNQGFIGFTSIPHNYLNNDLVTFTGKYDYKKSGNIIVGSNTLTLIAGVGSAQYTGIVTYFSVSGNLSFPSVRENDIYQIGNEEVKILDIDIQASKITVLRNQNGTTGLTTYSAGIALTEKTRKFQLNFGISTSYNFNIDGEIYFDPNQVVGLGTTSGPGITSTIFINTNNFNNQVSIGTGSTTFLFFNNLLNLQNYASGGYVDVVNATNSSFNTTKKKIIGIGASSIKIDFDSSSLSGVGVTAYVNKWNILEIPTQSIYIKGNNLKTGDSLIYSANGGTRISVSTNGSSSFVLGENSIVYVAKISKDLIGISTVKVGLGSTGTFVGVGSTTPSGILYFTSVGTGNTHSFKTNYTDKLSGQISKNIVTVSTAETHGLSLLDVVNVEVKSGISTTFIVKYDDYNRRVIINSRDFSSIDTTNNIITINNHKFYTGQKVIYTAATPASGLSDKEIYYVVVIDPNKIKLSNSYYQSTQTNPEVVNITTSQPGTISPINPPLNFIKNQKVIFDLSDSSLKFINNSVPYTAFDLKFYKDAKFVEEFDTTKSSQTFEVTKVGKIGIDSTASVSINVNDNVPINLYYNLVPANITVNSEIKKEIIIDDEVLGFNQITLIDSGYAGRHTIIGISSTSFSYNILNTPEKSSYIQGIEYYTDNSSSAKGPIRQVRISSKGKNYSSLPFVSSIESDTGTGSIFNLETNQIGRVTSTQIEDIGFDYSADYSVRPTAKLPSTLILESLSSFDYIGITSVGRNYNSAPSLVIIDGLTNQIITDANISYELGDSRVTINKNSTSINNVTPKIIPINNSNGIKIQNITFNSSTKDVTVTLGASFSDPEDYPFAVGSKVLIEGVSVGIASTEKGYNSTNYNYSLFTLTAVDPNLGGAIGVVTYNISSYLQNGEIPGTFNSSLSVGKIIPESHFPIFNPVLKTNVFYTGETVYSSSSQGKVEFWDSDIQHLKVSTVDDFIINETVRGETSNSVGIIKNVISFDADYKVDASSNLRKGWNRETGFLNNNFQRVHDSDYYQYFSYSLKSQKDFNTWNNPISALNHTAGFKKFSDLIVESTPTNSGISTSQNNGDFSGISDLSSVIDLNCVYDFDLARENNLVIDGQFKSNEILFNSRIIQDYIESIGNRVLVIDDFSNQFNSNPRPTQFSVAESFDLDSSRSKKYIALIRDKKFINEKQLSLVVLLHDNNVGFLNQYGLGTLGSSDLGSFDFNISGTIGNLLFYPTKPKFNDYHLELFSFSLDDNITGIGTIDLGNSVRINTSTTTIPQGTGVSTSIVGIASTYRSSKVLVQIGATDSSYYETNEITILNDGTNIYMLDYGKLSTDNLASISSSGIGTYNAYISGSEIKIDLIPDSSTSVEYIVNTFNVSLASTTASGIGTQIISGSSINSSSVSIASSTSPIANSILSYSNTDYNCSYCIISIEDKTNLEYQTSEFLVVTNSDENECYITEFGILQTESSLGVTTAGVSGTNTEIYFTPIENIDVDIKVFRVNVGLNENSAEVSLNNGAINYYYGSYAGTNNDIKKDFDLKNNNLPIFQRYFDGSNSSVVNVNNDTIMIPNHFYVTGEEIVYSYPGVGTTQAIGIATTSIAGIGTTDKLPSSLYVVKLNEKEIRVSVSASEALKTFPTVLDLTSVGIGNSHVFTSKNQNKKVIIGIDNVIQSPIISSSTTSLTIQNVGFFDSQVYVSGIGSIYGGDLIKINNEIMKVTSVGVGSTNSLSVIRPWMGTGLSTHASSSLVTKVYGNYNIVDNKIYFVEAPYGKIPLVGISNRPDEIDFVGIETGSTFSGRVFLRSGISDSNNESYSNNYIFDDISDGFNGIGKTFTLKSNGSNVSGISTDNAIVLINDILQGPNFPLNTVDYDLSESSGATIITFSGFSTFTKYDVNTVSIPRGGIIFSVGSTEGFGYQPLVAAGGTAIVSSAGTIQSISIGNSGSGYRSGIQTTVNVGVATSSTGIPNIKFIGTAAVSGGSIVSVAITNPGVGYTSSNPPIVIFDDPLSYSNIPLVYSSQSSAGVGTGAIIDIVVGQGSSVISFELKNLGYAYERNEILTISVGGSAGIPTNTSLSFSEFQISVDNIYSDKFAAWTLGALQVIDTIDSLFDGSRKVFPIKIGGNQTTIRSRKLKPEEVQATLLVSINDVLQVPGKGYFFKGGSTIRFSEAPKEGDTCKILFYKGTEDVDTQTIDILETIKVGDNVTLNSEDIKLTENDRLVTQIISSDVLETNLYSGPGITEDENLSRPLKWCRQTEDLVVNGQAVGKDRILYEPYIQPTTNIIQNIGIGSTTIFVESVKAFFDSEKEYVRDGTNEKPQNKILIISQDTITSAAATAIVSASGTISSIVISDGGVGYSTVPTVIIAGPIGFGTTAAQNTAKASATISGGVVTGIAVTIAGVGYTSSEPPIVLIESPSLKYESIDKISYEGDFGTITGINTTSVGVASTGIVFDLFIPNNSVLRDGKTVKVGIATTGISGIQTGYYFVISKSNVGNGLTSLNSSGSIVGVGTTFIDNIYQVASVSIAQTAVPGVGITNVAKVTVSVSGYNGLTGLGFSDFYGEYSWGRILTPTRVDPQQFTTYANIAGISSSPTIQRYNKLKYIGYSTT